jgi:gluconate kinase
MLVAYEEHYMRLVKNFRHEIEFINELHTSHTQEVRNFYDKDLPAIIKKLESEPIADDVRREWLKHLERHMHKSFEMSEHFIDILTTKKVEEFDAALREKICGGNVL